MRGSRWRSLDSFYWLRPSGFGLRRLPGDLQSRKPEARSLVSAVRPVSSGAMPRARAGYLVGFESLAREIAVEARELASSAIGVCGRADAWPGRLRCRALDCRLGRRPRRSRAGPSPRSMPARSICEPHAQLAARFDGGLGPRDRLRDPHVVDAPLGLQTRHGRVDVVGARGRAGRGAGGPALRTARAGRAS